MNFTSLSQALNQHLCGFGDSIVDTDYKDGERHHFFVKGFEIFYGSKNLKQAKQERPSVHIRYCCTDYHKVYNIDFPKYINA